MALFPMIVVGASMGGVEALPRLVQALPKNLRAALFIVMHVSPHAPSYLPGILSRVTLLPVAHASDGEAIREGRIYVAPPDHHLELGRNTVHVSRGPRENRHRPAIDPLFRSAAKHFRRRTIGVILTGALDDGTLGMQAIKKGGGITVVQHPDDAAVPSMPLNALRVVEIDHCLPLAEITPLLIRLTEQPRRVARKRASALPPELAIGQQTVPVEQLNKKFASPTGFICPDCNGPLWALRDGKTEHFRCVVGHSFSPESLLAGEAEGVERALWVAVKTLEERGSLLRYFTKLKSGTNLSARARLFRKRANESEKNAELIRHVLKRMSL